MKTALEILGRGHDNLYILLDEEHAAAINGLTESEAAFIVQKEREGLTFGLAYQLENWYREQLEKDSCDIAQVARLAEAYRRLITLNGKLDKEREERLAICIGAVKTMVDLSTGSTRIAKQKKKK